MPSLPAIVRIEKLQVVRDEPNSACVEFTVQPTGMCVRASLVNFQFGGKSFPSLYALAHLGTAHLEYHNKLSVPAGSGGTVDCTDLLSRVVASNKFLEQVVAPLLGRMRSKGVSAHS